MRRDGRLKQMETRDFTAAEDFALPEDFNGLIDLYHDGSTHYGKIAVVSPMELSERKMRHGPTGIPRFVAVIDGADSQTLRFAPEPSGTYTLRMVYESELEALSDANTSNWLLAQAPDLYLFATMAEAEAYLQEDERVSMWLQKYDRGAEQFEKDKRRRAYGGPLTPRPRHIIGEGVKTR